MSLFVTEAITELLAHQSITMVGTSPLVVNPLSVATNDRGKIRLVLDLRHINSHLHKLKFKCEDVDTAVLLLNPGDFLFTFDIKSAYHHIEIFKGHQQYLGFQWVYNGKPQYFIFKVLPFGLSTAPSVFTKVLKPLLRHWRSSGKRVCMFLDYGVGGSSLLQCATLVLQAVKTDLIRLGFLLSESKCFWEPRQIQTWLGHLFNMSKNQLFVTEARLQKLEQSLSNTLGCPRKVTARQLAAVAGQIMSMSRAIGPKVYLYTRHIYIHVTPFSMGTHCLLD